MEEDVGIRILRIWGFTGFLADLDHGHILKYEKPD
jgi:hypothetical protein